MPAQRVPEAQLATVSAAPAVNGSARPAPSFGPSVGATGYGPATSTASSPGSPAAGWSPTTTRKPVQADEELDIPDFLK